MTTPFPTQLSDLHFQDQTITPNIYHTLKHLKKSTLSLHNRLRSILIDADYITSTIHPHFPSLPLIANERCGSWYIPPPQKSGSAYFKSTDGHYGYWDFSLRRLNLNVLELLGRHGGGVLVDSTRRGKRMPDALRRTVPVWVLVWNRVLFGEVLRGRKEWEWAFGLQHPGLEPGEVSLIEARVEGWVEGLMGLGLDLEGLRKKFGRPVRLCWVVQGEKLPSMGGEEDAVPGVEGENYNLFVLCSASRRVEGAEMSEDGYVQGAADDAEGWSGGLTSSTFWEHQDELMATPEEELPDLLARLIEEAKASRTAVNAIQIEPTQNIFIGVAPSSSDNIDFGAFDLMIHCNEDKKIESPRMLNLGCGSGKLGSRDLRKELPSVLQRVLALLEKNPDSRIWCVCETGKDLSVGVAVTLLCSFFDDQGQIIKSGRPVIDKHVVKSRLAWITSIKPDANPSRNTLQAVHSCLM